MRDAVEQLNLLKRGVEQIVPEAEFRKKLERVCPRGSPAAREVRHRPDRNRCSPRAHRPAPETATIPGAWSSSRRHHRQLHGARRRPLGSRRNASQAHRRRKSKPTPAIISRRSAASWISPRPRCILTATGSRSGRFSNVLDLTRRMTLGQITAREDFAKRMAAAQPVYLHECLYPLMQGWDSVEIKADVELGGTEQLFSLLVARDLQQKEGQEPQVAMTMPILVGTDGVRRMGKSLGNYIGVAEPAEQQFGKIMSIPDEPMRQYFTLLTEQPLDEVDRLLAAGVNPRDAKESLAKAIVAQYHGTEAADRAAAEFRRRAAGEDPEEIPELFLDAGRLDSEGRIPAFVLLKEIGLETSTSNARRVIEQGGFNLGLRHETITDPKDFDHRLGRLDRPGRQTQDWTHPAWLGEVGSSRHAPRDGSSRGA